MAINYQLTIGHPGFTKHEEKRMKVCDGVDAEELAFEGGGAIGPLNAGMV